MGLSTEQLEDLHEIAGNISLQAQKIRKTRRFFLI